MTGTLIIMIKTATRIMTAAIVPGLAKHDDDEEEVEVEVEAEGGGGDAFALEPQT